MKKLMLVLLTLASLALSSGAEALNSPYYGVVSWLPSAARTASVQSSDQVGLYVTGIEVTCNVTAASGTGGLQVQIQGKDPVSGAYYLIATTTANTSTGLIRNLIGANVFNVAATTTSVNLNTYVPFTWRLQVLAGDSSSYTYSCSYTMYSSS